LLTHNGAVDADLSQCKSVAGEIRSTTRYLRGSRKELSADLSCTTYNRRIHCDAPYKVEHASRGQLVGRLAKAAES